MINNCVNWKIDFYMRQYIMPLFPPEKIHWYFSLSGGKDSFVLAESICNWYKINSMKITATGFHVEQWENSRQEIEKRFDWLDDLLFFDAKKKTAHLLKLNRASCTLCSNCSGIRKSCTDDYFEKINNSKSDMKNILCRGLHLTDTANSLLWRLLWEDNPVENMIITQKGYPLIQLFSNLYLAKPLCFVREYESQLYSEERNYNPFQCNCQALKYPCRRDIIEESVNLFYSDVFWEFTIPGIEDFFSNILKCSSNIILNHSLPGKEKKHQVLPENFFRFSINYFYETTKKNKSKLLSNVLDFNERLEDNMPCFLLTKQLKDIVNINFKLLTCPEELSQFDIRMISTLGPLWGAFSLENKLKQRAFQIQKDVYNFYIDKTWSQVHKLLELYYHYLET